MQTSTLLLAATLFVATYVLNLFYITVLYHRGLAHNAVELAPFMRKWVQWTGNWVTGIDPKAWACMHRLHHRYSDTPKDPHSPWSQGVFGVAMGQLRSYEKTLIALTLGAKEQTAAVADLDFQTHWLNRKRLWWLPYAVHALIAVALSWSLGAWIVGAAYWLGMMSHPVQGWMVNALAHKYGYQNYNNGDESRNNTLIAWLVTGEGYQNNHHANPNSAKFSVRWFEFDAGYILCKIAAALGWLSIPPQSHLEIAPASVRASMVSGVSRPVPSK